MMNESEFRVVFNGWRIWRVSLFDEMTQRSLSVDELRVIANELKQTLARVEEEIDKLDRGTPEWLR